MKRNKKTIRYCFQARKARLLQKEEARLVELTVGEEDIAVMKDVSVTAFVNQEEELEMKLEWERVEARSRKLLSGDLIEQTEKETQTELFKYKKQIKHLKQICPTPKSRWEK